MFGESESFSVPLATSIDNGGVLERGGGNFHRGRLTGNWEKSNLSHRALKMT